MSSAAPGARGGSLARKTAWGVMLAVALGAIMIVLAEQALGRMGISHHEQEMHYTRGLSHAERMDELLLRIVVGVRGYLITGDDSDLAGLARRREEFDQAYTTLSKETADPETLRMLERIGETKVRHRSSVDAVITLRRRGASFDAVRRVYEDQVVPGFTLQEQALDVLIRRQEELVAAAEARVQADLKRARLLILLLSSLGVLGASGLAYLILRPIRRLHGERERAISLREEATATLDALVASVPVGMAIVDRQMRYLRVNDALSRLHGVPSREHVGRTMRQVLPEGLAEKVESIVKRCLETGAQMTNVEIAAKLPPNGTRRTFLASAFPVRLPGGSVLGVGSAITEISHRVRREERQRFLAEASAVLATLLDCAAALARLAELAVPTLADLCVVRLEAGAVDASDRTIVRHADPNEQRRAEEILKGLSAGPCDLVGPGRVQKAGEPELVREVTDELVGRMERSPGCVRWLRELSIRSCLTLPLTARGRTLGTIFFAMTEPGRALDPDDLAALRELAAHAGLAMDNVRLLRAEQEALESLGIASHEIRSPLASLTLHAELLERFLRRIPDETRHAMEASVRACLLQAYRISALVEKLMDISRIGTGSLRFELEEVDLVEVVTEVVEDFQSEARKVGCALSLSLPAAPSVVGRWDRMRLEQIVTNLLSNAIKFGEGRPVEIGVGRASSRWARLHVRDHGRGIAPEDQARIFRRFERAEAGARRPGTGLGLWIVKQLVEGMGGSIRVESEIGLGSTFTVDLPCMGPPAEASPWEHAQPQLH
ncbi:MAG: PAS domain-containing protein [Deltaproteobacteria bacterium]|nr:PAS domain-containing protein [Deltaproteobacteria bacterium]